jgi:hypothetical protein
VDPDERSAKLAGFQPPEAPVITQSVPLAAAHPSVVEAARGGEEPSTDAECHVVVTSQESAAVDALAQPDSTPLVAFDVVVSAVKGIAEPVLPDIQTVEVNGERVAARERTAAEKKGSTFWISVQLPSPYRHLVLESQQVEWASPLLFPELKLSAVDGSAAPAGGKLQLPCNAQTRDCLRDGFMTLRIMRKSPESPANFTDAELEELQV